MGIRIISPYGHTTEVLPFAKYKGHTVWCWYNVHTLQYNLVYGKRSAIKKKNTEPDAHLIVEFSPAAFQVLAATGNTTLRDFAKNIQTEKKQSLSQQPLVLDAAMQQCISAM